MRVDLTSGTQRHKFVLSFAHEALRQTVLWRLQTLKPALGTRTSLAIHCLPPNIRDTSGRPIVVLRLADANIAMDNIKTDITVSLERMRVFLRDANPEAHPPVLQFTMVVDVSRAPVKATVYQSQILPTSPTLMRDRRSLSTWYTGICVKCNPGFTGCSLQVCRVAVPYYVSSNCRHSTRRELLLGTLRGVGRYEVSALLLRRVRWLICEIDTLCLHRPSRGLCLCLQGNCYNIFLPVCPPLFRLYAVVRNVPRPPTDYEGHIKRLEELTTPSLTSSLHRLPPSPPATPPAFARRASAPSAPSDPRHRPPISRFSLTNPFFGYPIDAPRAASPSPNNVPALRHGRRRKRDLVRALAVLFWQRWKSRIGAGVLLLSIFGLIKIVMVVRRLHGRRGGLWRIA